MWSYSERKLFLVLPHAPKVKMEPGTNLTSFFSIF